MGRTHPGRAWGPRGAETLPCSAPSGLAFPEEVKGNWSLQKDWVTRSNTRDLAEAQTSRRCLACPGGWGCTRFVLGGLAQTRAAAWEPLAWRDALSTGVLSAEKTQRQSREARHCRRPDRGWTVRLGDLHNPLQV